MTDARYEGSWVDVKGSPSSTARRSERAPSVLTGTVRCERLRVRAVASGMSLPSEHKALLFIGAVAILGAGVRVVRAANARSAVSGQPGLDHQRQSADSSARAESQRGARGARGHGRGRGQGSAQGTGERGARTARGSRASRADIDSAQRVPTSASSHRSPLERTGYIGGRLDLDVASAAQIDSLPGVAPAMAKRIVADRAMRGPFLTKNGLRRVSGVGPRFIDRIDSLVVFSGTIRQPTAIDTIIPRATRARASSRQRVPQ